MRLVVFSPLYRQMIHRPPKLNMEHMEPEAVPMFSKFGISLSRIFLEGRRTNHPNQPYGDDLPETCLLSVCLTARQLICMDTVRCGILVDEVLHYWYISNYQVGESRPSTHANVLSGLDLDDVTKSASGPVFSCSWYKQQQVFAFSPSSIKWMVTGHFTWGASRLI